MTEQQMNPQQIARAAAALDAWYTNPGGDDYRAPGVSWSAPKCAACQAGLEYEPGAGWVDALSGDEGGTFDHCPGTPDHEHQPTTLGELRKMHAALVATDTAAALAEFGVEPGSEFSTPEQDAQNLALMTGIRARLGA